MFTITRSGLILDFLHIVYICPFYCLSKNLISEPFAKCPKLNRELTTTGILVESTPNMINWNEYKVVIHSRY